MTVGYPCLLCLLQIIVSVALSPSLRVWDDVLPSAEVREELHDFARADVAVRCFARPVLPAAAAGGEGHQYNVLERTLDAILTEVERSEGGSMPKSNNNHGNGDGQTQPRQYVEYWTRQAWANLGAHADVDEMLFADFSKSSPEKTELELKWTYEKTQVRGKYRCPESGNVLYLRVGADAGGSPTCVFPGRSTGGELAGGPKTRRWRGIRRRWDAYRYTRRTLDDDDDGVPLVTVPAVPGRLLRFDGRDLHAVPRPRDAWLRPPSAVTKRDEAGVLPEESRARSVVLFNVWPGDEPPPRLKNPSGPRDHTSVNQSLVDRNGDGVQPPRLCNPRSEWRDVAIDDAARMSRPDAIDAAAADEDPSVTVELSGNRRRRDHDLKTVTLSAPEGGGRDVVRKALSEATRVTRLMLRRHR